ncbi:MULTISPECIES: hypothetical protein [Aliarcobacter]|jgi:hypothetical protein|uniref:hypothetical protein n=1 Tax=Aliarcobacter TaxID=2321111 RepID=UPI00082BFA04|nr:hypothetical protein [Aliarcobacter cryaerophilus]MCT7546430.1 hypothetical protein [Aliarcobacter cryaerophilus]
MKFEIKKVCDFDFIKIGEAYLAEKPLKASGISSNYKLALKLINEQFLNAEQSAYLVYEEDKLIYAGYYSSRFKKRWLREQNEIFYFWHSDNIDNYCNRLLNEENKNISVWLSLKPYAITSNKREVNISKLIEDEIIMTFKPILNKVGLDLENNKKNTLSVEHIVSQIINYE